LLRNTEKANKIFKRGTEILERNTRPLCGATCRMKYISQFIEQERFYIFKRYWSLVDNNSYRILSLNMLMSHQARLESL
jgi:hypothetical protein